MPINKTQYPINAESSDVSTYHVHNVGAIDDLFVDVNATALDSVAGGEIFAWSSVQHMQDHPDETYEVSGSGYSTDWLVDTKSDIGIFLRGYGDGLGHLLGGAGIKTTGVKPDLSIVSEPNKSLNDLKVLMIGSAALSGLDNSPIFKQKLADYVSQGGTIICFTQQHGYEFNVLPGSPSGYGWIEDESCWANAASIVNSSAIFNGQASANLTANVDGYFVKWPDNAKILLERTMDIAFRNSTKYGIIAHAKMC